MTKGSVQGCPRGLKHYGSKPAKKRKNRSCSLKCGKIEYVRLATDTDETQCDAAIEAIRRVGRVDKFYAVLSYSPEGTYKVVSVSKRLSSAKVNAKFTSLEAGDSRAVIVKPCYVVVPIGSAISYKVRKGV